MINDNNGLDSLNEKDNINASAAGSQESNKNSGRKVEVQGTTFTEEEIEEANKPQRNVILDKIGGSGISDSQDQGGETRDNERVNKRANEASDSTDTNTGGIAAGGAKGANQS